MEQDTIIKNFEIVVNDSYKESSKVRNNKATLILEQIDSEVRDLLSENGQSMFDYNETMIRFIELVKSKRPGYVSQDILNILILGFNEQLTTDGNKVFHIETLRKWLYEYGIKKDKESGWTVRNKWLKETSEYLKWLQNLYFYSESDGIPFCVIMKQPDAPIKYPYLYKFYIGDFEKEIKEQSTSPEAESMAASDSDLAF